MFLAIISVGTTDAKSGWLISKTADLSDKWVHQKTTSLFIYKCQLLYVFLVPSQSLVPRLSMAQTHKADWLTLWLLFKGILVLLPAKSWLTAAWPSHIYPSTLCLVKLNWPCSLFSPLLPSYQFPLVRKNKRDRFRRSQSLRPELGGLLSPSHTVDS